MSRSTSAFPLDSFQTFGDLLKYLRRRAQLTQRELAIAVGYTEGHLSGLETNQRLPDPATVAALFVPALMLEDEPEKAAYLLELAASAHGEKMPTGTIFTGSHTQEVRAISEREESTPFNLPIQLTSFNCRENPALRARCVSRGRNARLGSADGWLFADNLFCKRVFGRVS